MYQEVYFVLQMGNFGKYAEIAVLYPVQFHTFIVKKKLSRCKAVGVSAKTSLHRPKIAAHQSHYDVIFRDLIRASPFVLFQVEN